MKVLILAGGLGTRLAEETDRKPKPMVEIGGYPILWHIMKLYGFYGLRDFVILTGYKSHVIKEYFINYYMRYSNISVDLATNSLQIHNNKCEPWKVTMLYTGQENMTGSRIYQAKGYIGDESFCLTYGDGVSDVNITNLIAYHNTHKGAVTMTSILPEGRFGALEFAQASTSQDSGKIVRFNEKPKGDMLKHANDHMSESGWVNGGFFVCDRQIFDYLAPDPACVFEQEPLHNLAESGNLYAYKHRGFWQCMDTLHDKQKLTQMWASGQAPWALWQKPQNP